MSQQCQVCDTNKQKYKCPKCSIMYCSLACFKGHQQVYEGNTSSLCEVIKENATK